MPNPMEKILHVIVGPTASGKTHLAIEIATKLQTEIISADARQFYKGMDIGTAKPSLDELNKVKHHFIDNRLPTDYYSAGDFERDALIVVEDVFKRKKNAVAVGGSGLYIKALCEGMDEMPPVDFTYRNELIGKFEAFGISWLQEELQKLDPEKYEKIDHNNPQRIMRALEMSKQGVVLSKPKTPRNFEVQKYAIAWEREELYMRINERVDQMMEMGLLKEASFFYDVKDCNALQTVGYAELFDYLDGKTSLERSIELIKQHTRNYAKRQITWFKADPNVHWLLPNELDNLIVNLVQTG
jgi:tRNA dimethylallyltransferase